MIKIAITVRNRIAITKKCIEAIKRHSVLEHQIYIYDNQTNYKLENHFSLWYGLLKDGHISQVTFNTDESVFGAFSKAAALNQFGRSHEDDPKKDDYDYLLFLDNDIIVTPKYDEILLSAWKHVRKNKSLNHIRVIGQSPGGIKKKKPIENKIAGYNAFEGTFGGSAFWSVKPDFYRDIGFLDLKLLVGLNKKHDQMYWHKMSQATNGGRYILGLRHKLCVHCGTMSGSICNIIGYGGVNDKKLEQIKFQQHDDNIERLSFDEFYDSIINNTKMINNW